MNNLIEFFAFCLVCGGVGMAAGIVLTQKTTVLRAMIFTFLVIMLGYTFAKLDCEQQKLDVFNDCIELTGFEAGKIIYHNQTYEQVNLSNLNLSMGVIDE